MYWTVDRIEEEKAVLLADTGESFSVPKSVLPDAREGDVFALRRDEAERERRTGEAQASLKTLFSKR